MLGVQGDKYRKGEIFGTENLFRFKEDGSFLDDIWAESRNKGNGDSSGLEIHDSGKLSEVLLGMTDEDKQKVGEEDDIAILQDMTGKVCNNISGLSPGSVKKSASKSIALYTEESDSDDEDNAKDEPLEKNRAVNHGDLFRSDRGGAAIASGEEGFDEEMGGQTQAAYAIYENVKDGLGEEEDMGDTDKICDEDDDDVVDDDDNDDSNQESKREDGRIQHDLLIVQDKPEISNDGGDALPASLEKPTIANSPTIVQTKSDTNSFGGGTLPSIAIVKSNDTTNSSDIGTTSISIPAFNTERELAIGSTSIVCENNRSEKGRSSQNNATKKLPVKTIKNSNQTKRKICLMGLNNIDNATTEFSVADLRIPTYGKKKKKKKKKKKSM